MQSDMNSRHIVFDWQIGVIVVAAVLGWLWTYNRQLATTELALILSGVIAYFVMANLPDSLRLRGQTRSIIAGFLALLPAAIVAYFFLTNDWSRWMGKVSVLDSALRALAAWPLSQAGLGLNPNVIGGIIAALLPLQVFALRHSRRWVAAILIGLSLIALLLSQTRGAWVMLALVTGMWLLWRFLTCRFSVLWHARLSWAIIVLVCGVICATVLFITPLGSWLLGLGGDRQQIWRNSVDLVGDYPVTGLGLGGFEMAYSSYSLLVHVGHTVHAHNLWLDVWLNLGLLGVVALAGLIVNAVWPRPESSQWRMPALMALGVLLLHTLVDDPLFGYGGAGIPILFIPLGLLFRSEPDAATHSARSRLRWQPAFAVWGVALVGTVGGLILPQGRAMLEVNIGALQQTQQELQAYRWPDIPIQDVLRRPDSALTETVAHYRLALNLDATNAAAHRRLGQIELAREQYESACQHLAAAYAVNPSQRATRQMLGECAALDGQIDQAVELWRTIDLSQGQLMARQWWYESYLAMPDEAVRLRQAAIALNGD